MNTDSTPLAEAAVPISIPEAYGGMAECHGTLRLLHQGLQLEYRGRDGFLGLMKGSVKEATIPWEGLVDLKLHRHWFVTRLFLTVNSARFLEHVPGATGSTVRLAVQRKFRSLARELVFAANLRLCETHLRSVTGYGARSGGEA